MQQLDLFGKNDQTIYLYSEIEKLKSSTDRRCRAIFALLSEIQSQILDMKEKDD